MTLRFLKMLGLAAGISFLPAMAAEREADLLITGARVYTLSADQVTTHLQIVNPQDIRRFGELDVIA